VATTPRANAVKREFLHYSLARDPEANDACVKDEVLNLIIVILNLGARTGLYKSLNHDAADDKYQNKVHF
jgi:hypothetical protein